jgi:hypothetical protein
MDRRNFTKKAALAGAGILMLSNMPVVNANTKKLVPLNDAKKFFKEKGACSQTYCFLMNREFGHFNEFAEKAATPLAGGLLQMGHQCGMVWGASLATGAECYRRYGLSGKAFAINIEASEKIVASFEQMAGTTSCRKITNCDFSSFFQTFLYGSKIMLGGMENNICFIYAEKWLPNIIATTRGYLDRTEKPNDATYNCASEVVRKMGGTNEEISMVSGFSGGLGLSGNACGALAAGIWKKNLDWCRQNPAKTPSFFNNKAAKKLMVTFQQANKTEMFCQNICGRKFKTPAEHSLYVKNGGCSKLIDLLASA